MRALQSAVMTLLSGCLPGSGGKAPTTTEINYFIFQHSGMWPGDCYCYTLERTAQGVRLYMEDLLLGDRIVDMLVEDSVMERLEQFAQKHELYRWNGFDRVDMQVLDGTDFSLSITFADNSRVRAEGSNMFPDGYREAKQEICALFEELRETYAPSEQETHRDD